MAIYPYRCETCGEEKEVVQSISSYCESPMVPVCCQTPMVRKVTPVLTNLDVAPWGAYKSPIDGTVIDSRAKRNEHMARHGVVPYEEIKPDIERNRKRLQASEAKERREDLITAAKMTEAGHKPQVEVADKAVHDYLGA